MRANKIKQMWKAGKPVTLAWLSINNTFTAEVMARQGFDALCVDMQHGQGDRLAFFPHLFDFVGAHCIAPEESRWLRC